MQLYIPQIIFLITYQLHWNSSGVIKNQLLAEFPMTFYPRSYQLCWSSFENRHIIQFLINKIKKQKSSKSSYENLGGHISTLIQVLVFDWQ